MGRGRSKGSGTGGKKATKRKRVTVQLLKRVHAGEVTEPYRVMEDLLAKEHGHLEGVRFAIAWRLGWRPDTDGRLELGKTRKRGDLDRELDTFDFVLLLNKEAWPTLNAGHKAALVDHLLCHAQVTMDSDGKPKHDDRDRLVCRIKKHEVEEFKAVVERHGLYTADLSAIAQAAINDSQRPLIAAAERGPGNGQSDAHTPPDAGGAKAGANPGDWRALKLSELALPATTEDKIAERCQTLGELADLQAKHGEFWAKEFPRLRRGLVEDAWERFWKDHPEFCPAPTA